MKKLFILGLLTLSLTGSLFASIGKFAVVVGDVEVTSGAIVKRAKTGQTLEKNDIIATANGKAQIVFTDSTVVTLGKNTSLNILDYLNDSEKKIDLFVGKGAFKVITGEIGKIAPDRFKLKTKTLTVGIRGTVFAGDLSSVQEKITCLDGKIIVTVGKTPYTLKPQEQINVDTKTLKTSLQEVSQNDFAILAPPPPNNLSIEFKDFYTKEQQNLNEEKRKNPSTTTNGFTYDTTIQKSEVLTKRYMGKITDTVNGKTVDKDKSYMFFSIKEKTGKFVIEDLMVYACYTDGKCESFGGLYPGKAETNSDSFPTLLLKKNSSASTEITVKNLQLDFMQNKHGTRIIKAKLDADDQASLSYTTYTTTAYTATTTNATLQDNPNFAYLEDTKNMAFQSQAQVEALFSNNVLNNAIYKGKYKQFEPAQLKEGNIQISFNGSGKLTNIKDSDTNTNLIAVETSNVSTVKYVEEISGRELYLQFYGANGDYLAGQIHNIIFSTKKQ